jgi:hypothetical protein
MIEFAVGVVVGAVGHAYVLPLIQKIYALVKEKFSGKPNA